MTCPDYLILGLEQVFADIQLKRMQGVPVVNAELRVEADEKELLQRPTLEERMQQPISRRDLLRGNLSKQP